MPVVSLEKNNFPAWCEVEEIKPISLKAGEEKAFPLSREKQMILVCQGQLFVNAGQFQAQLPERACLCLGKELTREVVIHSSSGSSLALLVSGHWQSLSGAGIFTVRNGKPPAGDSPYDYWKTTTSDNHYHDSDAYWVILQGRCQVASEGKFYPVKPGDCVVTGRGWHHDIVSLIYDESATVAWFTGTLEGKKRPGHLYQTRDGQAEPVPDRV
ncbi:MAG: cupin domain-containing protein [Candidatus Omnitrophica bacterium]|nr:cupin domain-containing protein [Candidatus Omnitrophota bacterium]